MQITELYQQFLNSSGISTDTRKIEKGKIFFALKGENFNGNLFAEEAVKSGASLVIVDEAHFTQQEKIVVVEDALETLQQLAHHHRKALQLKVLAICGSNGKTTTKELIANVLETRHKIFSTKGNFNNHIGVPLTLLAIPAGTEIAIIEMGANHLKETTLLCNIAAPDYGLITNNGKDHLEGYGSIEGVRKGNGELYDYLRDNKGTAFVCMDQPDLMERSEGLIRITYGETNSADYYGNVTSAFPFLQIQLKNINSEIKTQLIGSYNFDNIMAAVAVGNFFGIATSKVEQAIAAYIPSNNRSQLLQKDGNTFILDAYNANPSSMQAALLNFTQLPSNNKVLILGDMLELGASSELEHSEIIQSIDQKKFRFIIFVGKEFGKAMNGSIPNALHFENVMELRNWFNEQHFSEHYFLLKGSRLIGLEKLVM
ncbi:MAG: UDP-N-acetylmuramoyl-tripeptide--D-alanyl-D-alanine ligase [Chitinophagales bacterium]